MEGPGGDVIASQQGRYARGRTSGDSTVAESVVRSFSKIPTQGTGFDSPSLRCLFLVGWSNGVQHYRFDWADLSGRL